MSDESNKGNPIEPSTKSKSESETVKAEERRARDRILAEREEVKDQSTRYFGG
jgi:hypothetical protein